jgi:hypothetical protein
MSEAGDYCPRRRGDATLAQVCPEEVEPDAHYQDEHIDKEVGGIDVVGVRRVDPDRLDRENHGPEGDVNREAAPAKK